MKREFGLDLTRSVAIFFVLSVHFFLNNGFYTLQINSFRFIPALFFRNLFYTSVPLFLLITGYLKSNKRITKDYYKSIKKIIISYITISIICLLFKKFYLHEIIGRTNFIISIFNFSADRYSWYIEMYIGLFLLIPFLNVLYNSLESKKQKQLLIVTFIVLISFSPVINFIFFRNNYLEIIPNWWDLIYPLFYYFIGAYIKEYQINYNKLKFSIILLLFLSFTTLILYLYNRNNTFSWNFLGGYNGITTVISSTMIFLLLYNIKIKNKIVINVIKSISVLSLDIYLFSVIPDTIIYSKFDIPIKINNYFKSYLIIVPLSFSISYLFSYIKKIILERRIKF